MEKSDSQNQLRVGDSMDDENKESFNIDDLKNRDSGVKEKASSRVRSKSNVHLNFDKCVELRAKMDKLAAEQDKSGSLIA